MTQRRLHTLRRVLGVIAYCVFLTLTSLGGVELILRWTGKEPQRHYVWPPHMSVDFEPSDEATPGVRGTGRFRTNSLGLRSDEPPADVEQIVYVFGGSTAIDVYLDQDEAWVQQLQSRLNAVPGYPRTWVGNLARSSLASLHNLMHFDRLLPELPRADLLVDLIGVNDLQLALKSSYLENMSYEDHLGWAFAWRPLAETPWDDLAVVRIFKRTQERLRQRAFGVMQTHTASGYINWRDCRQTAPSDQLVHDLPDLQPALTEYRRNLLELADRADAYGAPIVFLTQPTLWSEQMGGAELGRLLAGGIGPNNVWCRDKRYYAPDALASGMRAFNDVLRSVCEERRLRCIDLADRVPRSAEYFWDDMHLSEAGAALVSSIVAHELQTAPAARLRHTPRAGSLRVDRR